MTEPRFDGLDEVNMRTAGVQARNRLDFFQEYFGNPGINRSPSTGVLREKIAQGQGEPQYDRLKIKILDRMETNNNRNTSEINFNDRNILPETKELINKTYSQIKSMARERGINLNDPKQVGDDLLLYVSTRDVGLNGDILGQYLHRNVTTKQQNGATYKSFIQTLIYVSTPKVKNGNTVRIATNAQSPKTYYQDKYAKGTNGKYYKTIVPENPTNIRNYYQGKAGLAVQFISPVGYHHVELPKDKVSTTRQMIITHVLIREDSPLYQLFKDEVLKGKTRTFNVKRFEKGNTRPTKPRLNDAPRPLTARDYTRLLPSLINNRDWNRIRAIENVANRNRNTRIAYEKAIDKLVANGGPYRLLSNKILKSSVDGRNYIIPDNLNILSERLSASKLVNRITKLNINDPNMNINTRINSLKRERTNNITNQPSTKRQK